MRSQGVTCQYHIVRESQSRTRITFPAPGALCTQPCHAGFLSHPQNSLQIHKMQFPCSASMNLSNFANGRNKCNLISCTTLLWSKPFAFRKTIKALKQSFTIEIDVCGSAIAGHQTTSSSPSSHGAPCSVQLGCRNMNITINLTVSIFQNNRHIMGWNSSAHFKQRAIEPPLNGCLSPFHAGLMNKDEHLGKFYLEIHF